MIGTNRAQLILPADPYSLIRFEKTTYIDNRNFFQTTLRPQIIRTDKNWSLIIRNELFYNNGTPNLENMSNRFIGKGIGLFNGINLTYNGRYASFSIEPYFFTTQNKEIEMGSSERSFALLNNVRYNTDEPYIRSGLRETQFYFTYRELSLGISNANMWWGPGIHTSLSMTNNTTGFPHFFIGTLKEKKYNNIGFNARYVFTQLDKTENDPYYTAFVVRATFYMEPIITIGLNRNILSPKIVDKEHISEWVAATKIFNFSSEESKDYQILSTYFIIDFPENGLKLFFELGTTEKWKDFTDFLNYPDHGIGSIFGFRQYGPFNNQNLVMGFEYARLVQSSFWEQRPTLNWYGNPLFDYSSYDGHHWAAHSGADSDDLYIYIGYNSSKWSLIPSLNYERHGVLYARPAEVKMEIRLDFNYMWKDYRFNLFFEREWLEHAGFVPNKWRIGNVIWIGVEKDLTNMFSNKLDLIKN